MKYKKICLLPIPLLTTRGLRTSGCFLMVFHACKYMFEHHWLQPILLIILILSFFPPVTCQESCFYWNEKNVERYGQCLIVSVCVWCLTVHQSPVSTQRHSPRDPFEAASSDSTNLSSYCPDYTVRALTDLQLIRVRTTLVLFCIFTTICTLQEDLQVETEERTSFCREPVPVGPIPWNRYLFA